MEPPEGEAGDASIRGVTSRSGEVEDGFLFVAVPGSRVDGHDFVDEAVERGAAALLVERDPERAPPVPVVRARSTRRALAGVAAAWHGHPARRLSLTGITGTVGKTSVLSLLEAMLDRGGTPVASIGSLGLRESGRTVERTSYTAPDPLLLHGELARVVADGYPTALMEVTSHALDQERVAGLRYDLGVFTNLVPLEHADYHGSFRAYVEVKRRFLDHLAPRAPLIHSVDDPTVRRLVGACDGRPVGCGRSRAAVVRARPVEVSPGGTRLELDVRRPLPRVDGGEVPRGSIPVEMRLLGRSNLANATLAAAAALCLGVEPEAVRAALADFPPPPRRMRVVHRGRFTVIDDTLGHPDSVSALFEVVECLSPRRVHAAYAVRGGRGTRINRENGRALAVWAGRTPLETLVVTRAAEAAGDRDRVDAAEHEALVGALREGGLEPADVERLDEAVEKVLSRAEEGDLVLLLGAQGMDRGAELARAWLEGRGEDAA